MHVLVTGGAGYIGFSLVRALAGRNDVDRITVIDNLARRSNALFVSGKHGDVPVDFRRMDILDGHALDAALADVDVVYHLAAHATTPQSDIEHHVFDQVNNWGTAQVARSIERSPKVSVVVHLSSFAVYGSDAEPFDEHTVPAPTSTYGLSKLAGEPHLLRLASPGRRVHIVRAGNVFGFNPAIRFDSVINAMAFDAWTERRIRIHGDGAQTRPFIDVGTLAGALADLAFADVESGTWNAATHNASVNEIADVLYGLVPDLEHLALHRDARMQQVSMKLPVALAAHVPLEGPPLQDSIAGLITALRG